MCVCVLVCACFVWVVLCGGVGGLMQSTAPHGTAQRGTHAQEERLGGAGRGVLLNDGDGLAGEEVGGVVRRVDLRLGQLPRVAARFLVEELNFEYWKD